MIIVEIYQRKGPPNKAFSIDTMSNFTKLKIEKVSTKVNDDSCEIINRKCEINKENEKMNSVFILSKHKTVGSYINIYYS